MITRNIWLLALAAVALSGWGCTRRLVGAQSDARPANPSATSAADQAWQAPDDGLGAFDSVREVHDHAEDAFVPGGSGVAVALKRNSIYEGGDAQPEFLFVGALEAGERLQVFSDPGCRELLVEKSVSASRRFDIVEAPPLSAGRHTFYAMLRGADGEQRCSPDPLVYRVIAPKRTTRIFATAGAFAALKEDGSVVAWGTPGVGGDPSPVAASLSGDVSTIVSTYSAFVALNSDGSAVWWGQPHGATYILFDSSFGSKGGALASDVLSLDSTHTNVVARTNDRSSLVWPKPPSGRFPGSGSFPAATEDTGSAASWFPCPGGDGTTGTCGVIEQFRSPAVGGICSTATDGDASAALMDDGSVMTWGSIRAGADSSAVATELSRGVRAIFCNRWGRAFAALKHDGSVITWGDSETGGDSSAVASQLASGVEAIFGTRDAFAALKQDGSVVTWGNPARGGDSSAVAARLAGGVTSISSSYDAFAALKADGSVVTWSDSQSGGDSSRVAQRLASGVTAVFSTADAFWAQPGPGEYASRPDYGAFAALRADGSVVTWRSAYGTSVQEVNPVVTRLGGIVLASVAEQLSAAVRDVVTTSGAFAALKDDGSVVSWGPRLYGGDSSVVSASLTGGVSSIARTAAAFAALKDDGSVVAWGPREYGGDTIPDASAVAVRLTDVARVTCNPLACVALKRDGAAVTWNLDGWDGRDASADATKLVATGVRELFSNETAFAALKKDGSVVTWGKYARYFGSATAAAGDAGFVSKTLAGAVRTIVPARYGFAAIMEDGTVVTWGDHHTCGPSYVPLEVAWLRGSAERAGGVSSLIAVDSCTFAALKDDGSVVSWGFDDREDWSAVAARLTRGVVAISRAGGGFAALKEDGSVVFWGRRGSRLDAPDLTEQLDRGVSAIFGHAGPFAAVKQDGSVVTWRQPASGEDASSAVVTQLVPGIRTIFSNGGAFAALKQDGSVVTWGHPELGGDSSAVAARLDGGVREVFSSGRAFAALKQDGSVVTWGDPESGGDSSAVAARLDGGVREIFSKGSVFAALKQDGSVVTWGRAEIGGDSSAIVAELAAGVTTITGTPDGFIAVRIDGSVVAWGRGNHSPFALDLRGQQASDHE